MPRRPLLPTLRLGAALAVVAVLLYSPRRRMPVDSVAEPAIWAVDIIPSGGGLLSIGLRATAPLPGQKRPPCTPVTERELVGACWIGTEHRPPCPERVYEVAGRCVMPVEATARLPTSIQP